MLLAQVRGRFASYKARQVHFLDGSARAHRASPALTPLGRGVRTQVLKPLTGKQIFALAGTLRPETMCGQTNAWILPEGEYGAFEVRFP